MWLSLEVLHGSNTLHICYHSDSLSVFKKYLQILISLIFLGDDRFIKKEMWQQNSCAMQINVQGTYEN